MADGGLLTNRAEAQHLLGKQWGLMNETGSYPGQPWLWLYALLVPGRTDLEILAECRHPGPSYYGRAEPRIHLHPLHPGISDLLPRNPDLQADLARALPRRAEHVAVAGQPGIRSSAAARLHDMTTAPNPEKLRVLGAITKP